MSVSVLIITHGKIGEAILAAARETLGELPLPTKAIAVEHRHLETLMAEIRQNAKILEEGDGVLILADIYGATPCNLAQKLQNKRIQIVTGLNLPMLLRVMNYCYLTLPELAHVAYDGGRNGVAWATQPVSATL